ncbi:MAG: thioesterase family protein [Bacteroidota bacterium]
MMTSTIEKLLADYPSLVERAVIWGDMDAARHVNNTVYVKWSEVGRTEYLAAFEPGGLGGEGKRFGPILHTVSCKFIYPLTYPDTVYLGTRISEMQEDRFVLETLMVSQKHARVAALATGIIVWYDYQAWKKAPLPENFEERIQSFEADARRHR